MQPPYIVVKCEHCGQIIQTSPKNIFAGKTVCGHNTVYVDATCPQCGKGNSTLLNGDA